MIRRLLCRDVLHTPSPQRWSCQCAFLRPSLADAPANPARVYPSLFTPCRQTLCSILISHENVCTRITVLLLSSRPYTIVHRIAGIVVTPLDGMCRGRPGSHISQERQERLAPRLTDGNPAPAIIFPLDSMGIFAALDHIRPYGIFRRLRFPMCSFQCGNAFIFLTSATLRVLARQVIAAYKPSASAGTGTPIAYFPTTPSRSHPEHKQPCKLVAGQIAKGWHRFNLLLSNAPEKRMSRPVRKRACQIAHEAILGTPKYSRGQGVSL